MAAPVCKISPAAEPILPRPITPMAIPIASDLQSAIQAINAMRQIIINITIPPNNTNNPNGGTNNQQANFQEVKQKRVTTTVRVTNPDNPDQYVDVQQITGLTFVDPANGQTINWSQ